MGPVGVGIDRWGKVRGMGTVLVVDDEKRVVDLLTRTLTADGYSVVSARDGVEALERLREQDVDLVLLDLMMPRLNGLQVLEAMRSEPGSMPPVIVLSAVDDIAARVDALDRGAVDYIGKPFHNAELVARVRRHTRARQTDRPADNRYVSEGGIRLDLDRRRAVAGHGPVSLTEREFSLLAHLMRRSGMVCRRDELLHDVWGLDFDPGSNVVEVCVRRIRAKLPDAPIETVRGVGYLFESA